MDPQAQPEQPPSSYLANLRDGILDLSHQGLTELPADIPEGVTVLYCNDNLLTSLPETLPDSIEVLVCSNNAITGLPNHLPASITNLHCANNQLSGQLLPELPVTLRLLDCNTNAITSIPALPASIEILDYHANDLSVLPDMSGTAIRTCLCYGNPALPPPTPGSLPASLNLFIYSLTPPGSDYNIGSLPIVVSA